MLKKLVVLFLSLFLVALTLNLLSGCATFPEQRRFEKPYPMWASFDHWYFSNIGYKDGADFRELQLSDEQGWWGEEVILVYDYEPDFEFIDTLEGK